MVAAADLAEPRLREALELARDLFLPEAKLRHKGARHKRPLRLQRVEDAVAGFGEPRAGPVALSLDEDEAEPAPEPVAGGPGDGLDDALFAERDPEAVQVRLSLSHSAQRPRWTVSARTSRPSPTSKSFAMSTVPPFGSLSLVASFSAPRPSRIFTSRTIAPPPPSEGSARSL